MTHSIHFLITCNILSKTRCVGLYCATAQCWLHLTTNLHFPINEHDDDDDDDDAERSRDLERRIHDAASRTTGFTTRRTTTVLSVEVW